MKALKEIINESPKELATLATALLLEEVYIGAGRNFICSGYESICNFLAKSVDAFYHTIYPF